MSQTHPSPHPDSESEAFSYSNYQHIFSHALESYKKRTGNDLTSNPLLPRLKTCNSSDAVIALLRQQIPGFDWSQSDNGSGRLSNWLNPTVNVITAFSGIINGSVGMVCLRVFYSESRPQRIFSIVTVTGEPVEASEVRDVRMSGRPGQHATRVSSEIRSVDMKRWKSTLESFENTRTGLHYAERTPHYLSSYKPACTNG